MTKNLIVTSSAAGLHQTDGEGFTLVELLVVLAIIGMLITAMPAFIAKIEPGMRLKAAARDLADTLRAARATAIVTHRETLLTLNVAAGRYQTTLDKTTRELPDGIKVKFTGPTAEIAGNIAEIRFYADGSSTGGRIDLSSDHGQHSVETHWLMGMVTVDE